MEQNIDIEYLSAQFEMTGGSIKNAVLTALFLATGQKQKCSMTHILKAIKQKLQKHPREQQELPLKSRSKR